MTDQISATREAIERYDTAITQTLSFVEQQKLKREEHVAAMEVERQAILAINASLVDADEAITHYRKQRRGEAERLLALESKE